MSDTSPGRNEATEPIDRVADDAEATIQQAQHRAEDRIGDARDAATAKVRRTEQQLKSKVRDAETTVRRQVAEVQDAVGGFDGLSEPTPAGSVGEAVEQATQLRRAIDRDLDALQAKLPPGEELAEKAKTYGGAALGVLAVAGAAFLGLKQRGERKRVEREAKAHAAAIARYLPQAAGEPRSDDDGGHGGLLLLALLAAIVGAVVAKKQREEPVDDDLWGPA
ncbi:MAG: hypothetical protein WEB03_08935 [Nitriliruptor sp.]|uniref:hypothetical protein n=1 Tax=Nitriliruptor sp. TaxID=2448056 RepID=UPI00349FD9A0